MPQCADICRIQGKAHRDRRLHFRDCLLPRRTPVRCQKRQGFPQRTYGCAFFGDDIFRNRDECCCRQPLRRPPILRISGRCIACPKDILSLFKDIGRTFFIVFSQGIHREGNGKLLFTAGAQFARSCKAHKAFCFRAGAPFRNRDVDLNNFCALYASSVAYGNLTDERPAVLGKAFRMNIKCCIGQTVSERILRFHAEGVKIAVPDINPLDIILLMRVLSRIGITAAPRIIVIILCPCPGQFT